MKEITYEWTHVPTGITGQNVITEETISTYVYAYPNASRKGPFPVQAQAIIDVWNGRNPEKWSYRLLTEPNS